MQSRGGLRQAVVGLAAGAQRTQQLAQGPCQKQRGTRCSDTQSSKRWDHAPSSQQSHRSMSLTWKHQSLRWQL